MLLDTLLQQRIDFADFFFYKWFLGFVSFAAGGVTATHVLYPPVRPNDRHLEGTYNVSLHNTVL
jgi:hypothetical protein